MPISGIRLGAMEVVRELDLPKFVVPLVGLCLGYAAQDPGMKPRILREAVCFDEGYNRDLSELIDQYDQRYSLYRQQRGDNSRGGSWTETAAKYYREPYDNFQGVVEMLDQQGFWNGKD